MTLVNDQIIPVEFLERSLFTDAHLVGGDTDVPRAGHQDVANECLSCGLITNETNSCQGWNEALELVDPVLKRRFRSNDDVRTF